MFLVSPNFAFLLITFGMLGTFHETLGTNMLQCHVGSGKGEVTKCGPDEASCRVDAAGVFKCSSGSTPIRDDGGECVCIKNNCNESLEKCQQSVDDDLDGSNNPDAADNKNKTTTMKPSGAPMMGYQNKYLIVPGLAALSWSGVRTN